jgi:hypothetical protein
MTDILALLQSHDYIAYFVSASAGLATATIAVINARETRRISRLEALRAERSGIKAALPRLERIVLLGRVAPWAVLEDATRDDAAACLRDLNRAAKHNHDPEAWHALLDPHEYDLIKEFLLVCEPLVLLLRQSRLGVSTPSKPYNGDKHSTAWRIYQAFGIRQKAGQRK